MKKGEVRPTVVPVIVHAYGRESDKIYDLAEQATQMFDLITGSIRFYSHGIVNYKLDVFVRADPFEDLPDGRVDYKRLVHYLDWNRGFSVSDRVYAGYRGEFWLFSPNTANFLGFFRVPINNHGKIPTMGFTYGEDYDKIFERFIFRLRLPMLGEQWAYAGSDPRKWLSRLPARYWEVITKGG